MRFVNETPEAAGLLRGERAEDVMIAALVVRVRRAILPAETRGGVSALGPVPRELALDGLRMATLELGEYGELEADDLAPRSGTDVIVLGDAVCREPSPATRVEVLVDPYAVKLDVFGKRVWDSVLGALVPTSAESFVRMPLTWANAYGGAPSAEYGPIPWHMNPLGKGHYLNASQAKGGELPNVESSARPMKAWDDRPSPAGVAPYPRTWGLRTEQYVRVDPKTEEIEVMPENGMFDRAHPLLSGARVGEHLGEEGAVPVKMTLKGMTETGFLELAIGACPFEAQIEVGPASVTRQLELEEILVDLRPEIAQKSGAVGVVDLTWRKMFRYQIVPFQRRETRLVPRAGLEKRAGNG